MLAACAAPPLPSAHGPRALEAVAVTRAIPLPPRAPITLTSGDGNELELVSVVGRSVVAGPLAFTQLKLTFRNPEPRVIEGRFRIALPRGASVGRFAMKIDDTWQEGEMVPKAKARAIYEDFLHRRVDPALLEQGEANAFSARVFPIPAHGVKELVVSYGQPLHGARDTLVPLRGLGRVGALDVHANALGATPRASHLVRADLVPESDFTADPQLTQADVVRSEELVVARVKAKAAAAAAPLGDTVFLLDTSASRALELGAQIALLEQLLARLGDRKVLVLGFDQTVRSIYEGPASELGPQPARTLRERRAMGASDLEHALSWAGRAAQARGMHRIVLIGDGVVTAGGDGAALRQAVKGLAARGVARLDAVAFGGIRDDDGLEALVRSNLERDGVSVDGTRGAEEVWRRLNRSARSGVKLEVEGARWWWPRTLDGVQPGDQVLVHADVPVSTPLRIRIDGVEVSTSAAIGAPRALLERSSAQAKIASLLERERREGPSAALESEIVTLSTQHRVMSPYTSLLVLETQGDYDRYGLDRDALVNVLEVAEGELAVVQRRLQASSPLDAAPLPAAPLPAAPLPAAEPSLALAPPRAHESAWGDTLGESFGAGSLSLHGAGEGGGGNVGELGLFGGSQPPPPAGAGQAFGTGHGRLGPPPNATQPDVRAGATRVSGRMPPEVIQRVVRANFARFRACYRTALQHHPALRGQLVTRFGIGTGGKVVSVTSVGTAGTLATPIGASMAQCVANAMRALVFPAPDGGVVTVTYPMTFEPNPSASPAASAPQKAPSAPYSGPMAEIMALLDAGRVDRALSKARAWQARSPTEMLAFIALGEAYEAKQDPASAARAYGSVIDLFPTRADLRRYAGSRLDRLDSHVARRLAIDTYQKARNQRPDHPTSHRLLAFALLAAGRHAASFAALEDGLVACTGRYAAVASVLRRDLGLVAASWLREAPSKRAKLEVRLAEAGATLATEPSLGFVLSWETDANDVDLHVHDTTGGHAFYGDVELASGGKLAGDITTGYGPEMFVVDGVRRAPGYRLQAHYYAQGPMGYGMGKLQVIEHDGHGKLTIDDRPFVVMSNDAFVDLGAVGAWSAPPKLAKLP